MSGTSTSQFSCECGQKFELILETKTDCDGTISKATINPISEEETNNRINCSDCEVPDEICNKHHDCVFDVWHAARKKEQTERLEDNLNIIANHFREFKAKESLNKT